MNPNEQQDNSNPNELTPDFGTPEQVETPATSPQIDFSSPEPTPQVTTHEPQPFGQPVDVGQPPVAQPTTQPAPFPAQPQAAPQTNGDNPGQVLGIVSIVLSFLGLSLIGIILGVISRKKSKAVGASDTLGTVGMIVGIVFTVVGFIFTAIFVAITLTAYNGIQDRAEASTLSAAANTVEKQAEAYYLMSNDYPKSVTDFSKYPESTLPSDIDVNSAIYTNTAVTYVYCGENAAQIVYLGETANDKIINALGTASSTEECPRAY